MATALNVTPKDYQGFLDLFERLVCKFGRTIELVRPSDTVLIDPLEPWRGYQDDPVLGGAVSQTIWDSGTTTWDGIPTIWDGTGGNLQVPAVKANFEQTVFDRTEIQSGDIQLLIPAQNLPVTLNPSYRAIIDNIEYAFEKVELFKPGNDLIGYEVLARA